MFFVGISPLLSLRRAVAAGVFRLGSQENGSLVPDCLWFFRDGSSRKRFALEKDVDPPVLGLTGVLGVTFFILFHW